MGERLIVIGGTAAGLSAASKAKRCRPEMEITVFEKSGYVSYGACGLPYFVGDLIKEAGELISLTPEQLREKRGIPTYTRHEVTRICRETKTVEVTNLEDGSSASLPYDALVIATGARPILPPLPGVDAQGVVCLRTVEDGIRLKGLVGQGAKKAVIIGGGFIGLEVAEELTLAGVQIQVVEALPRLLPFLPQEDSKRIADTLERHGVGLHTDTRVVQILTREGRAVGVETANGDILSADLVLLSVGVVPESRLAEDCGLALGLKKGIRVDESQRTSDPAIWACGDCVEMKHILTGKPCYIPLGTTANKQGRVAGGSIGGETGRFPGVLGSQVTKIFDQYIASTGLTLEQAREEGFDAAQESIVKGDRASYYPGGGENRITLVFDTQGGRLLGAQALGTSTVAGRMNVLVAAITAGMTVSQLNDLDLVYSPSVAPVYDPLLIAASQAMKKVK